MYSSRNDPVVGCTGRFALIYCLPNLTGAAAAYIERCQRACQACAGERNQILLLCSIQLTTASTIMELA